MPFHSSDYGPDVQALLELDGDGDRLIPLVQTSPSALDAKRRIAALAVGPATRAGLYFYLGFWDLAHETAQDLHTQEGSYWHALVHRQEPDSGNSEYWFRQTGVHPIFVELRETAAALGFDGGATWDPSAFIQFCEMARQRPGSGEEICALQVQRAEWRILFDYCATRKL